MQLITFLEDLNGRFGYAFDRLIGEVVSAWRIELDAQRSGLPIA
jgi:hypothetical protein